MNLFSLLLSYSEYIFYYLQIFLLYIKLFKFF